MNEIHYIGFDVHKRSMQFCSKLADGGIVEEGRILATRTAPAEWTARQQHPWKGALEATMFSAWINLNVTPTGDIIRASRRESSVRSSREHLRGILL